MAVTNYYAVNGQLLGEKTVGSSRIDYLTDALGSVTATLNQSAQVVNTYRNKPYGGQLAKTGTGPDPAFLWAGSWGYRQTGRKFSDVYVRARSYDTVSNRWTTKDPYIFWMPRWSFAYADASPITKVDWTGLLCDSPPKTDCCKTASIGDGFYCKGKWRKIPEYEGDDGPAPGCKKSGDCKAIMASLRIVAGYCTQMCDKSQLPGSDTYGLFGGGGKPSVNATQICCQQDGKSIDCGVYWCPDFLTDGQGKPVVPDPCAISCLYKHEKRHSQQNLFMCSGSVKPDPKKRQPKNMNAWGECDAYYVQLTCLLDAAKLRCPVDTYKNDLFSDSGLQDLIDGCTSSAIVAGVVPGQSVNLLMR